jgi:DNA polymerase-3 subunit beta
MQFNINREKIFHILKQVSGVVDKKKINPICSCVLLSVSDNLIKASATDQSLELQLTEELDSIIESGNLAVPFRQLFDICKVLPNNSEINFKLVDLDFVITSNASKFVLKSFAAEEFPDVQQLIRQDILASLQIERADFFHLLDKTVFAMAEQDVRFYFNGILFEVIDHTFVTVAADGHRLAKNSLKVSQDVAPFRVIIPRKTIFEVMRLIPKECKEIGISISKNHVQFTCGNLLLTSGLVDGKFPNYNSVIPTKGSAIVLANREKLKEALQRASALFVEKFKGVRLRISENNLKILGINSEQDKVEEDLSIEYIGENLEVGFNIGYLIDFLTAVQSEKIKLTFTNSSQSVLIQDIDNPGIAYVLMPVRM